jgi:hypothetical protein
MSLPQGPVTPHRLTALRRQLREARELVKAVRAAALRSKACGANLVQREEGAGAYTEARAWAAEANRRLLAAQARGVERGSAMSPAAWARHLHNQHRGTTP